MTLALVILLAINSFDILIRIRIRIRILIITDRVESMRIVGNVIIIVALVILLAAPRSRRTWVPIAASGLSLVLNLIYCATEGTGTLGWILVTASTLLGALITFQLPQGGKSFP
jgi:hypothetical protein